MECFQSAPFIRTRQEDMPIWTRIKRLLRIENLRDSDERAHITRIQRTYDEDHQQMAATLTLAEYLNLLSGLPLPSTQQKSEFAEFVSAAHSWYKHLPANLPGQSHGRISKMREGQGSALMGEYCSQLLTMEWMQRNRNSKSTRTISVFLGT
jgi:hypothetical protein